MRKVLFILGELSEGDLDWLMAAGRTRRVAPGEAIIREGEPLETMFLIADGSFSVVVKGNEVARLASGEVAGDMSLLDSRPPNATVQAVETGTVFAVPHDTFRAKLRSDTGFGSRFYRALCLFLADRLGRTTTLVARDGLNVPATTDGDDDDGELSPELLDNVSLAGARFDRFLERIGQHRGDG
ncbi:MAG: cyclic nucleotide-binding domain-containing protein [Planctomycetota bacterium]